MVGDQKENTNTFTRLGKKGDDSVILTPIKWAMHEHNYT